jgi:hypothetical protein
MLQSADRVLVTSSRSSSHRTRKPSVSTGLVGGLRNSCRDLQELVANRNKDYRSKLSFESLLKPFIKEKFQNVLYFNVFGISVIKRDFKNSISVCLNEIYSFNKVCVLCVFFVFCESWLSPNSVHDGQV